MLIIVAKEPWKLSSIIDRRRAFVATGRAAFEKLKEAASVYGVLLDALQSHKWIVIKLATDDAIRTAYKLKVKKRSIDRLREMYGQYNYVSSIPHAKKTKPDTVIIAGIVMHLQVTGSKNGALTAQYYTRDIGEALIIADKLRAAGLSPNVVESTNNYVVYIATADLVKLAEQDEIIRRKIIAQYLTEKAKNRTPRQKELAEKLLKRIPLFSTYTLVIFLSRFEYVNIELKPIRNNRHIELTYALGKSESRQDRQQGLRLNHVLRPPGPRLVTCVDGAENT